MSARSTAEKPRPLPVAALIVLALLVTGDVVLDWRLAVPDLPPAPTLAVALLAGTALGVAVSFADVIDATPAFFEDGRLFLVVMVTAIAAGFLLFPDGVPPGFAAGFFAFVWSNVAVKVAFLLRRRL